MMFFQYLFLREDISLLSIFEVFEFTEDIPHFLENLKIIDNNSNKRSKFVVILFKIKKKLYKKLESYEFDEEIERQFTIIYLFGNYFEITERILMEEVYNVTLLILLCKRQ